MPDEQESVSDPRDVTIRQQAEMIRQQGDRLKQLEDQVKRLQALLEGKADAKAAKQPVFKENYRRRNRDRSSLRLHNSHFAFLKRLDDHPFKGEIVFIVEE